MQSYRALKDGPDPAVLPEPEGVSVVRLQSPLRALAPLLTQQLGTPTIYRRELRAHLDAISTVICVFLDWNESRRAFAQRLRGLGAGVKIVVVRNGPCSLDPALDEDSVGIVRVLTSSALAEGLGEL